MDSSKAVHRPGGSGNPSKDHIMARYILIDSNSGYIFGDSADIDGRIVTGTPSEVAAALDASIGAQDRIYTELTSAPRDTRTGYLVYRADIDGAEAVQVVRDGQDQDTIEAVQRDCEFVCFVEVADAAA